MQNYEVGSVVHFISLDYSSKELNGSALYQPLFDTFHSILNSYSIFALTITSSVIKDNTCENAYLKATDAIGNEWKISATSSGRRATICCPKNENVDDFIKNLTSKYSKRTVDEMTLWGAQDLFQMYSAMHRAVLKRIEGKISDDYFAGIISWRNQYLKIVEDTIGEPIKIVPLKLTKHTSGSVEWTFVISELLPASLVPKQNPDWCSFDEYHSVFYNLDLKAVEALCLKGAKRYDYKGYLEEYNKRHTVA